MGDLSYAGRYKKGARFEYDVRDHLTEHGWVSTRAAGSKGGMKTDLISIHPLGVILLIQCKTNGVISEAEWNRIYEVALWNDCMRAIIAYKGDRGGIVLDKITGFRVRMKPNLNRLRYDPAKANLSLASRNNSQLEGLAS